MKTNLYLLLLVLSAIITLPVKAQTGQWKFDDETNLLEASIGSDLKLIGTHSRVDGPSENNGAIQIPKGSYYKATHGIGVNGGGQYVNEYTIVTDIRIPSAIGWKAIFNSNAYNSNPAECFITPEGCVGLGSTGYSDYKMNVGEWYRLVIVVDLGSSHQYYLDGKLVKNGNAQSIDGTFSLDPELLFFADKNGEDEALDVAELSIYGKPLTKSEVVALGGYNHEIEEVEDDTHKITPYLQSPSATSATISWHGIDPAYKVIYGTTSEMNQNCITTSELVASNFMWNTAKLTELSPSTLYYYQVVGEQHKSEIYSFKTHGQINEVDKIRFLILGDTQDDPVKNEEITDFICKKSAELYGDKLHDAFNFIVHVGDLVGSGSTINQYTDQFFKPFSPLTAYIPTLITAGNHELEHTYYYKYIINDEISGQPKGHPDFERYWSKQIGRTLFIGLNSTDQTSLQSIFPAQEAWLKKTLDEAEVNSEIDFVFCFIHAPAMSELWVEATHHFTANRVLPLLKKYAKVQQLTSGHTHAYERGVVKKDISNSSDITLLSAGGGGGDRDRWGEYTNRDYPDIHTALDHHFFVIGEIDTQNKSYQFKTYSLGNKDYPLEAEVVDSWSGNLSQDPPQTPIALNETINGDEISLEASLCTAVSPLFSSEFEVIETNSLQESTTKLTVLRNQKNIYEVLSDYVPWDKNLEINLTKLDVDCNSWSRTNSYSWKVRYRDENRKWSEWSAIKSIVSLTGLNSTDIQNDHLISYADGCLQIKGKSSKISINDLFGKEIVNTTLNDGENNLYLSLKQGIYVISIDNAAYKFLVTK